MLHPEPVSIAAAQFKTNADSSDLKVLGMTLQMG